MKKKREADFSIVFRHWIKANPLPFSCTFEMKQTTANSIPFSCVEENQAIYHEAIRGNKGVLIRVQGSNGEPDYNYYRNAPAFIVIKYPKSFHIIGSDTFQLEKKRSKRRSLTEERARAIAVISVDTSSALKRSKV